MHVRKETKSLINNSKPANLVGKNSLEIRQTKSSRRDFVALYRDKWPSILLFCPSAKDNFLPTTLLSLKRHLSIKKLSQRAIRTNAFETVSPNLPKSLKICRQEMKMGPILRKMAHEMLWDGPS